MAFDANNLTWDVHELKLKVQRGSERNLKEAIDLLKAEVKQELSVQGAIIPGKRKKNPKTGRYMKKRVPSAPGEPPHKWTGRLFRSVRSKVEARKGRARVIVAGGNLTEFGTKKMAARPYLRPALAKLKSMIALILVKPVP
jgi:hypothetical protein